MEEFRWVEGQVKILMWESTEWQIIFVCGIGVYHISFSNNIKNWAWLLSKLFNLFVIDKNVFIMPLLVIMRRSCCQNAFFLSISDMKISIMLLLVLGEGVRTRILILWVHVPRWLHDNNVYLGPNYYVMLLFQVFAVESERMSHSMVETYVKHNELSEQVTVIHKKAEHLSSSDLDGKKVGDSPLWVLHWLRANATQHWPMIS